MSVLTETLQEARRPSETNQSKQTGDSGKTDSSVFHFKMRSSFLAFFHDKISLQTPLSVFKEMREPHNPLGGDH